MGSSSKQKGREGIRVFLSKKDLKECGAQDVPQTVVRNWIKKGKEAEEIIARLEKMEQKIEEFKVVSINFYLLPCSTT